MCAKVNEINRTNKAQNCIAVIIFCLLTTYWRMYIPYGKCVAKIEPKLTSRSELVTNIVTVVHTREVNLP